MRRDSKSCLTLLLACAAWITASSFAIPLAAQEEEGGPTSTLVGRVLDFDESAAVVGATVRLEDTGFRTTSNAEGLFRLHEVPPGIHVIVVTHLLYGSQRDTIDVVGGETVAVRITVSRRPIHLEPLVVSVLSHADADDREVGTRVNEITRSDIEAAADGAVTLGEIIGAEIPGAWIRNRPTRPGDAVCVEFRQPGSVRDAATCTYPMMLVDGILIRDPGFALTGMTVDDVERIRILSPAAAGLPYGTGGGSGVILVETRRGPTREKVLDQEDLPYALGESSVYPWALEPDDHPWRRAFAGGLVGNAIGLTAGHLLARECLESTGPSGETLRVRCGTWETVGTQLAAAGLPILGTALGTRIGGRTRTSRGELVPAILGAAIALIPGYVVATSGPDPDRTLQWLGMGIISLGMPAMATFADHLFRSFDPR